MTEQPIDPFAPPAEKRPSVSFKDAPVGTVKTLEVQTAAKLVQARDFETGQPAFWPDGNPKYNAVLDVVDTQTGIEYALWAAKPSALFAAIGAAQQAAGVTIAPGGTLTITYTGDKPNANPRLNPAKQYAVTYMPPNAFADAPAFAQSVDNANGGNAQLVQHSPEVIAAFKAAGIDPNNIPTGA